MEDVYFYINIFLIFFVVSFCATTLYLRYKDKKAEEEKQKELEENKEENENNGSL